MSSKKLTIGNTLQARCAKCRKITSHTIVAMIEEVPTEVACNICKHPSVAKKLVVRRPVDPHKSEREEWATLIPGMDTTRATEYSMTAAYKKKALLNHPIFGIGLVQRVTGPQKMVVLFAEGEKIMRCH